MCEITVSNLHSPYLNRKMYLLLATIGSKDHSDGWGFSENLAGKKCGYPAFCTSNIGGILQESIDENSESPFLGHIRKASPMVPVSTENAHPFTLDGISFVHNGKLTPKNEKDFVIETSVLDYDLAGNPIIDVKTGKQATKIVKRSDSLVFFEKFMEIWKTKTVPETNFDDVFVETLTETMALFYGKFAMVFNIRNQMYIARGKTADLHISFLRESKDFDSPILGWAINTNKVNLELCTSLLSNLEQLDNYEPMYFSYPTLLTENTVYRVDYLDVTPIGKVEENSAPAGVTTYYGRNYTEWGDYAEWEDGSTTKAESKTAEKSAAKTELEKLTEEVYQFCETYALAPQDIFYMLFVCYGNSSLELSEIQLQHFCREVLPKLRNYVSKEIRKSVKRAFGRYVPIYKYNKDMQYPWLMNTAELQKKFLENK